MNRGRFNDKSSRSKPRTDAGFTLLEVMAAFIIAALASILLYQAGFNGVSEAATAARYQEAMVRAQSRLASVGVLGPLRAGQFSGNDGGGFRWRLNIIADQSYGTLTLYDIRVTESFGNRQVSLATQRLASGA